MWYTAAMLHPAWSHRVWRVIVAGLICAAAACNGSHNAATAPAQEPASGPAPGPSRSVASPPSAPIADACGAISDWRSEIIQLPPEFAPTLPAGQEELRFAPGMFEPAAADYFTYAFVLRLAAPMPPDGAQIEALLDTYFQGLVAAVAKSRGLTLPVERVDATVTGQAPTFQATVAMYDAFVTGAPLILHIDLAMHRGMDGACVRAAASPQPRSHEVWQQLAQAAACLPCTL